MITWRPPPSKSTLCRCQPRGYLPFLLAVSIASKTLLASLSLASSFLHITTYTSCVQSRVTGLSRLTCCTYCRLGSVCYLISILNMRDSSSMEKSRVVEEAGPFSPSLKGNFGSVTLIPRPLDDNRDPLVCTPTGDAREAMLIMGHSYGARERSIECLPFWYSAFLHHILRLLPVRRISSSKQSSITNPLRRYLME